MALKGTIKDFGIADIFQLIGQQVKTGVLILRDTEEVRVFFKEGSVVRADTASRPRHMLLGAMMLNAELLSKAQLDAALKEQKKSLRRIGVILAEMGLITEQEVKEFAKLQMMETVCALFQWKNGTYEFEQTEVEDASDGAPPVRAENILMEGLRMIDEWPMIRRHFPNTTIELTRGASLPDAPSGLWEDGGSSGGSDDFGELDAFGESDSKKTKKGDVVGTNERRVYDLIEPGRDLEKLIHLSRLGEFETLRAAASLVDGGFAKIRDVAEEKAAAQAARRASREPIVRLVRDTQLVLIRTAIYAALVAVALLLSRAFDPTAYGLLNGNQLRYGQSAVERCVAQSRVQAIRRGLEVYRLERGDYPLELSSVVRAGILGERDVRFPYRRPYFYKREAGKVVILPPVD